MLVNSKSERLQGLEGFPLSREVVSSVSEQHVSEEVEPSLGSLLGVQHS